MADGEHLKIFTQGIAAWNQWRQKHHGLRPDLSGADLRRANFCYANLNDANLENANLEGANLGRAFLEGAELHGAAQRGAHFFSADLRHADLREADLREAQLWHAHLDRTDLRDATLVAADLRNCELAAADLRGADLEAACLAGATLLRTDLRDTNLAGANLHGTRFIECRLAGADLSAAEAALTTLNAVDLSRVRGLDTIRHERPSSIGVDTLARTIAGVGGDDARRGQVTGFLRAAGVPEHYLALKGQEDSGTAAVIYIVHSLADRIFARRLYDELQRHGRRCWLYERPMLPGDGLDDSFDLGPRCYDALILCCSGASLTSWWLAAELDEAVARRRPGTAGCRDAEILLPINLGGAESRRAWAKAGTPRNLPPAIADFTTWDSDEAAFERALEQVLAGIDRAGAVT